MKKLKEIVILSGGKSTRFGSDKALAKLNGKSFIEILSDNLSRDFHVKISTQGKIYIKKFIHISDENKDIGPIEGIRQAIKSTNEEFVGIVSVDTPLVKKEMFKYLEEYISSDYDIYVFKDGEKVHPLCGIYRASIIKDIEKAIENDQLSVTKFIEGLHTKYVDINNSKFDRNFLKNFNYINEVEDFEKKIVAISGVKNSGKTSLICSMLPYINEKVNKFAVIKHDGHDYSIDHDGTDTYKYMQSGATDIGIFSEFKSSILKYRATDLEDMISYFIDFDLIILEGCKDTDYPKIEICRKGNSSKPVCRKNVYAIATDMEELKTNHIKLDLNNPKEIADFIINNI